MHQTYSTLLLAGKERVTDQKNRFAPINSAMPPRTSQIEPFDGLDQPREWTWRATRVHEACVLTVAVYAVP